MGYQICIFNPWGNGYQYDAVSGSLRDRQKAYDRAAELSKQNPEWLYVVDETGPGWFNSTIGFMNGSRLDNPRHSRSSTPFQLAIERINERAENGETFGLPRYTVQEMRNGKWDENRPVYVTEQEVRAVIRKATSRNYGPIHARAMLDGRPVLYAVGGTIQEGDIDALTARFDAEAEQRRQEAEAQKAKANAALVQRDELIASRIASHWSNTILVRELQQDDFVALSDAEILAKLHESATELNSMIEWLTRLSVEKYGHVPLVAALFAAQPAAGALVDVLTPMEDEPQS